MGLEMPYGGGGHRDAGRGSGAASGVGTPLEQPAHPRHEHHTQDERGAAHPARHRHRLHQGKRATRRRRCVARPAAHAVGEPRGSLLAVGAVRPRGAPILQVRGAPSQRLVHGRGIGRREVVRVGAGRGRRRRAGEAAPRPRRRRLPPLLPLDRAGLAAALRLVATRCTRPSSPAKLYNPSQTRLTGVPWNSAFIPGGSVCQERELSTSTLSVCSPPPTSAAAGISASNGMPAKE